MKYSLFAFSLFISFCALSQETGAKGELFTKAMKPNGKTHVILVGVSEYKHLDKSKQLDYADDDTELMNAYLSTWENVIIKKFINENASSKDEIGFEIHNTLNVEAKSGDQVIIYFSGHGDVDTTYGDGYLLLNGVSPPNDRLYRFNQALSMNDLEMMMEKAANNGVEVLLITDACKSGSIQNARDANQRMLNIGKNTSSLVSCGPEELSFESIKYGGGHGVFTYYLVQGLMGLADANSDMVINFKELSRYVEDNVAKAQSDNQNPQSRGVATKKIAQVNSDLKTAAKTEENLMLSVNTFAKNKALSSTTQLSSSTSGWITLMQELIEGGVFFDDEIINENDNASISLEKLTTSYSSSNPVYAVSSNFDGSFFAASSNKEIALYDRDNKLIRKLKGHKGGVTAVQCSPWSNTIASGSWDNSIIIWNANSGEIQTQLKGISDEAYSIEFLDRQTIAIGNNKGDLYLWNFIENTNKKFKISKKRINDLEKYNQSLYIASADGKIRVFDLNSKTVTNQISAHNKNVTGIKIAPIRKQILSVGYDKFLKKWDLNSLTLVEEVSIDYGENRGLDIDVYEAFCFIVSRRYDMDVINLDNNRTTSRFMSSRSSGLVSVNFSAANQNVVIGDSKGRVHNGVVSIKQSKYSASKIHKILSENPENAEIQYRIDGTMLIGLNNYVTSVLNPLVNGNAVLPTKEEIIKAKRYAKKALEVGANFEQDLTKLKINLLLLEVFEIIELKLNDSYSDALNKTNEIIKLDPKGAYAFNISGALLVKLNKFNDAKESGNKAEQLAPGWAEASCGSGKILLSDRDYHGAEQKFIETIEKGPNLSKGYYYLGKVYNLTGKFDEAKQNLYKADEIDNGIPSILVAILDNAMLRGDIQEVKRIIRNNDSYNLPQIHVAKSDLVFLEDKTRLDYNELHSNYLKAIEIDSLDANSINSLGYFYLRLLNDKDAKKFIDQTFTNTSGNASMKSSTVLKRKCKELFKQAYDLDNDNLKSEIGNLMSRGSTIQSSTVSNLLNKHNQSAEAYAAIGRYYIFKKEYKLASKQLKKAMSINPNYYPSFLLAIEANKMLGKSKKNTAIITKYKGQNPESSVMKIQKDLTKYLLLY